MKAILTTKLQRELEDAYSEKRVIFFSAPCGFGKSTVAAALAEGKKAIAADFRQEERPHAEVIAGLRTEKQKQPSAEIFLVDHLQNIQESQAQQELCSLICDCPKMHFILMSRGPLPGWLMPFELTGLMKVFSAERFLMDFDAVHRLMLSFGLGLSSTLLESIQKETNGYPLALTLLAEHLKNGEEYCAKLLEQVRRELYLYFQEMVYFRFDAPVRRLLLTVAPFEPFNAELARFVSGDSQAGKYLGELQQRTTMLQYDSMDSCHFWPIFRDFLLWRQEQEYRPDDISALYRSAALYYELHDNDTAALACYQKVGDHGKISKILIRNSEKHPGLAHFEEMEPYYRALPREEILASPVLMCGMSMLDALVLNYEESEKWYQELKDYADRNSSNRDMYREARGWLAYLDVALPQRGSAGLVETIKSIAVLLTQKKIAVPEFSVTSMLPSLMNGGKDFCAWSKRDDFLYTTMRGPLELMLGKGGVGMADCAITESKLEKGENVSNRISHLYSLLSRVQQTGTPDMEFVIVGLTARWAVDQGRSADAVEDLMNLRERFIKRNETRFLPNLNAMRCRIDLYRGDMEGVEKWYHERAPKDRLHFHGMWRYQYMTKAMVEIALGNTEEALKTLGPLETYFAACGRVMDGIHLDVLTAICLRRDGGEWKIPFTRALAACEEYGFLKPVSQYGSAVLPMLEEVRYKTTDTKKDKTADIEKQESFRKQVLAKARIQAVFYPNFLNCRTGVFEPLSPAEKNVLRLMCADKSNAEIADTLGISLTTVKTHVSSIFRKLGVKRRGEAKTMAEEMHLC